MRDVTDTNEPQRLLIPGLGKFYQHASRYAYAMMRFATGAILVPHGAQKLSLAAVDSYTGTIAAKGLPFPELLAVLAIVAESLAAVCVAIGLLTRPAAVMIAIEMLTVVFVFQWRFGYYWTARGVEYPLLLAVLCVAIAFRGGGRYSIDHLIGKEL